MSKSGLKLLSRRKFTFANVLYIWPGFTHTFDRQTVAEVRGKITVNFLSFPEVTSGAQAALLVPAGATGTRQ
jgi:hypothetical protein